MAQTTKIDVLATKQNIKEIDKQTERQTDGLSDKYGIRLTNTEIEN